MFSSFRISGLAAAAIVLSSICFGDPAAADTVTLLSVQSGHSILLRADGLSRVAVGDGRIAGVVPIGTSQIVVNGKSPGHTTVLVWARGRRSSYEVTVTEQQLDDLAQMLRGSLADPNVQVMGFNHSIVVRGAVSDGAHFQSLSDILSRFEKFAAAQKYTIVNAVTVARPLGDLQHEVSTLPGASDIRVDPDGKGNVIVSGRVRDAIAEQAILDRARGLAGRYLASDGKLINRLASDTTSQVDVKVYILEVDRTALRQLGVRLQGGTPDPTNPNSIILGLPSLPIIEAQPGAALNIGSFFRTTRLVPTLDLILQEGHARLLSAPDLVTMPGNEATFLVGGELPIPYSTGLGQVSIVYKEFGVRLKLTPTLLGNGSVETKIAPEVSDLDFQNGVQTGSFVIPALKTSRLATDVVTKAGESIIMGGMLRRIESRNVFKVPLLGDLPILGQLFRSTRYQNSETDIVFVMTPEIITR
ncbi:MAG: pilus assembly protein N-terminal domain-containing protein [Candidatus Eremiobacteraeota bacterium]|nr:pilus assembly protein N-terminal domain-containing protein [Candidatus Eremiobacteraeota bacterium]